MNDFDFYDAVEAVAYGLCEPDEAVALLSTRRDEMEIHKLRRMFAYDGSCLFVALEGDERSHEEWFKEVRLDINKHTRGYVKPGLICFYFGKDFSVPEDYKQALRAASHLAKDYRVGLGMEVGPVGTEWKPLIEFRNQTEALECSTLFTDSKPAAVASLVPAT